MTHLKSESVGNLLIRNIQCFKSGNTEKIWLWLNALLQRRERWLKEVQLRSFFMSSFSQMPVWLPCWVVREPNAQKCLTSFGLAKLNLCPGKLPDWGLNKREIHFNSCHFGGIQSSQGSCKALKAVVTLREAGSWGCRTVCVCDSGLY